MSVLVCEKPIATDVCPRCGDLAELVGTLREEVGQLRREVATLRAEAGYWKSRHADAVKRNGQLQAELQQAHGEIRQLKAKLFGRKAERRLAGQDLAKLVEHEGESPPRKRGGHPTRRRCGRPGRMTRSQKSGGSWGAKRGKRWRTLANHPPSSCPVAIAITPCQHKKKATADVFLQLTRRRARAGRAGMFVEE